MNRTVDQLLKLEPNEMLKFDETPTLEDVKNRKQIYFEDVNIGDHLPKYIHRYSQPELTRWCISIENAHRVHYDLAHAHNHDNTPGTLFHGTWRMSIITKWLKNWVMPDGWMWKMSWQIREMVTAGETTILSGIVSEKQSLEKYGLISLDLSIKNEEGWEGCPGSAKVALPFKEGDPVPYPFIPPSI